MDDLTLTEKVVAAAMLAGLLFLSAMMWGQCQSANACSESGGAYICTGGWCNCLAIPTVKAK